MSIKMLYSVDQNKSDGRIMGMEAAILLSRGRNLSVGIFKEQMEIK